MKINNLSFKNPVFLSPMAGAGDFAFRYLCRKMGADFSYTEMISVKALLHNSAKTKNLLFTQPFESPAGVQLFGNDEGDFAKAVKLKCLEGFDLIDLNFGCPAPKIFKNNEGSALLDNPLQIYKIVSACVKNSSKPISAKIRLGIDENSFTAVQIAKACEDAGAVAITLHGRFKSQGYKPKVDLEKIALVKSKINIPLIGNGDIVDKESYLQMLGTKVDGVSLARGALGKPWIFNEIKGIHEDIDLHEVMSEHYKLLKQAYTDDFLAKYLRKHFLWYLQKYNCPLLKKEVATMTDVEKTLCNIKNELSHNKIMH